MIFNSPKKAPHDASEQINDAKKILGTLQPVLDRVHSNKATVMFSSGFDWVEEFFFYFLAFASFVFIFIMDTIFPFHVLGEIVSRPVFREQISNASDISGFNMAVKGLIVLIGILFIMLGLKKRVIRKSKNLLYSASSELKKVEEHLSAKVATLTKLQLENPPTSGIENEEI